MSRLFSSNGIRNIAITKLTCELVWQIGRAVTAVLDLHTGEPPEILIAKDTRISSDILEASLCAGICSAGGNAGRLGILPASATAYLAKKHNAEAGIMISASHMSADFNGIRIFSRNGLSMSEHFIEEIESLILDRPEELPLCSGTKSGRMSDMPDSKLLYLRHLQKAVGGTLNGLKIAVDCANGSASGIAKEFYSALGAEVVLLNASPDGMNINLKCGSEYMPKLMDFITEHPDCHAGIAFNGDASRCLAVDENGKLVDGDQILAILADDYQKQNQLRHDALVMTSVSNLGLTAFAKEHKIRRIVSNAGDISVLEQMQENGCVLGGEPNGQILFLKDAPVSDGLLIGAKLLEILSRRKQKFSTLASIMHKYPSVMMSVRIPDCYRENWKNDRQLTDFIEHQEHLLGSAGRVLVRENSSDSAIRILAEGDNFKQLNQIVTAIASEIRERITVEERKT